MSGPKDCVTCGRRAPCTDSRESGEYIRRRYVCKCGHRWTTGEVVLTKNGKLPHGGVAALLSNVSTFEGVRLPQIRDSLRALLSALEAK